MSDQPSAQDAATPTNETAATEQHTAPDAIIGLVTDGAHTLIVAQFSAMDDAQAAYEGLKQLEATSSLRIDGVIVASCDAQGKVHLGKVTEHSTKTGLKWGIVGGAALALIFPPTILAGAAGMGVVGAMMGKIRNVFHRRGIADELAGVMTPNTSGVVALVEDTAVVEVREALAKADRIVTKAIDKQVAAEIDREAAQAKAALTEG